MYYMRTSGMKKGLGDDYFEAMKIASKHCAQNDVDVTLCNEWRGLMIFHPTCDIKYVRISQLSSYLRGFMPTFFQRIAQ